MSKVESRLDIRRVFDSVAEIWIIIDRTAKVVIASRHLEKFNHLLSPPVREGRCFIESVPESWQELASNVLNAALASGLPSTVEANYKDQEGKEVFFEIRSTPIKNQSGEIDQIFIEARDVTPQKSFEKKITVLAREYRSLIEYANAVIIGTDIRGYITEWNECASQVTGYSKNESYLQRFSDYLSIDSQEKFMFAIRTAVAGQVMTGYELIMRSKDNRRLSLLINATPTRDQHGEIIGVLLIGQDISEQANYRESLEQKVRERTRDLKSALEKETKLVEMKDRFVSMASHELRSPISYIHRQAKHIKDDLGNIGDDELRMRLDKIQHHAEHLSALLEDVLTIGRNGAAVPNIQANLKPVDLKSFFHRIIDEVQTNTHNSHLIELDFPQTEVSIMSDENLLRNIFVNLLTNAIKFSPGQQKVFVSVDAAGEKVECRVKDLGLGIEEKDLPKIFEPFHRGDNAVAIKGTGLGLPIVKKAVETLGGDVEVQSARGQGTLFTVSLNR